MPGELPQVALPPRLTWMEMFTITIGGKTGLVFEQRDMLSIGEYAQLSRSDHEALLAQHKRKRPAAEATLLQLVSDNAASVTGWKIFSSASHTPTFPVPHTRPCSRSTESCAREGSQSLKRGTGRGRPRRLRLPLTRRNERSPMRSTRVASRGSMHRCRASGRPSRSSDVGSGRPRKPLNQPRRSRRGRDRGTRSTPKWGGRGEGGTRGRVSRKVVAVASTQPNRRPLLVIVVATAARAGCEPILVTFVARLWEGEDPERD